MNALPLQLHRLVLVLALMLLLGCAAKKQAGPAQPPVQAPSAAATPEATPEPAPSPSATPAQQSQLPAQGTPPPEPEQTPAANSGKTAANEKQHPGKKPSPGTRETAKNSAPKTTVVPADAEPPTSGGTISPGGISASTPNEPSTEQLLQSTETSLNSLNRQLSSDEQVMVMQIRDFINRSRQATKDNDGVSAHNLALRAHLLCDDLMKHR